MAELRTTSASVPLENKTRAMHALERNLLRGRGPSRFRVRRATALNLYFLTRRLAGWSMEVRHFPGKAGTYEFELLLASRTLFITFWRSPIERPFSFS